ncbi:50S ribosomal protein L2 [Candidatus Uhrbacteria bacterium]|nr:50S ribosomal protein L2 [Candidatus Uhrbacteria bacterium]
MPLIHYKPTTAGRRGASVIRGDVSRERPVRALLALRRAHAGRNAQGKITVRHRGGGVRRFLRIVDRFRNRYDAPATVRAIEYDPNRNARLARLEYGDGELRYIIAPLELVVGMTVVSSRETAPIRVGNRLPLERLPVGILVHDVELQPGQGGRIARGAGTAVQLMAIDGAYAQLKMPSGEVRLVPRAAAATIGQVGNPDARLVRLGKAGRMRKRGIRPRVRGKAMNPVDHPHGGGEGHNPIGMPHAKTPWGRHALGVKTRSKKKWSNKFILQRRPA